MQPTEGSTSNRSKAKREADRRTGLQERSSRIQEWFGDVFTSDKRAENEGGRRGQKRSRPAASLDSNWLDEYDYDPWADQSNFDSPKPARAAQPVFAASLASPS
eukprot:627879-Pyramimonas_sp.AAC.1